MSGSYINWIWICFHFTTPLALTIIHSPPSPKKQNPAMLLIYHIPSPSPPSPHHLHPAHPLQKSSQKNPKLIPCPCYRSLHIYSSATTPTLLLPHAIPTRPVLFGSRSPLLPPRAHRQSMYSHTPLHPPIILHTNKRKKNCRPSKMHVATHVMTQHNKNAQAPPLSNAAQRSTVRVDEKNLHKKDRSVQKRNYVRCAVPPRVGRGDHFQWF